MGSPIDLATHWRERADELRELGADGQAKTMEWWISQYRAAAITEHESREPPSRST